MQRRQSVTYSIKHKPAGISLETTTEETMETPKQTGNFPPPPLSPIVLTERWCAGNWRTEEFAAWILECRTLESN